MNDKEDRGQLTLERLTYVEFLEAIGRVAVVKFLQSELEELPLSEKICSILDELFAVIDERRCEMTEMDGDSDTWFNSLIKWQHRVWRVGKFILVILLANCNWAVITELLLAVTFYEVRLHLVVRF